MKKIIRLFIFLLVVFITQSGCDKGFEDLNKDPNAILDLEPGYLFSSALRATPNGGLENEHTVAFQFLNAYSGLTEAFNLNAYNDNYNAPAWNNQFTGPVKNLLHVINLTKDKPERSNLYNEARIWLAYSFMVLVDTYGDVPYTEAGKAYLEQIPYPKYDKAKDIYESLRNEFKSAAAALDATKANEAKYDVFFQGDVNKWKRLGYSLLLRLGMRYSKTDANLAKTIVQEAVAGGVMQSNADNVIITYNTVNTNPTNGLRNTNSNYYYFAEPFINQLKNTSDPRLKFLAGKYANAGGDHSQIPDTTTAKQVGFPVGQDNVSILTYPGRVIPTTAGGGFNYSQINFFVFGHALAPRFIVTYAQTKLLLAEAAFRGWIPGGMTTAQQHYEEGVKAALAEYSLYPNGFGTGTVSISTAEQNAFITNPGVAWDPAKALELINTQYWIASFSNGSEAWFNKRRSGFPVTVPNPAKGGIAGDGFVHRFYYPIAEQGVNRTNYEAAKASMGGDDWTVRVFWDAN